MLEKINIKKEDIVEGIKHLPVKPTVRIVMSKDIKPKDYVSLFVKNLNKLLINFKSLR